MVKPERYQAPEFGSAEKRLGDPNGFWYFRPKPIPRSLEYSPATIQALSLADAALGQLSGFGHLIKDPQLLIGPYITREALASSRIEGTQASLSDVLQANAGGEPNLSDPDIAEVNSYIAATYRGLELLSELPISQRLVLKVHEILLSGVRGQTKLPGEFRSSPVWVGSPTDTPDNALFVPPLPELIPELISDWEFFLNDRSTIPTLVKCALMHYQFETIHPFLDGNGRIGRLLVGLLLIRENRIAAPLLYLSGYLESHRQEYYDRLQAVREKGEVQEWLQFFLTAVRRQAEDGVSRARQLVDLRERYIQEAAQARSRVGELVTLMFANPFITAANVESALGVTNQGARNLIKDAETRGWLQIIGVQSRGRRSYWVAMDVFRIVESQPS